jgi:hypothetical protein
MPAPGHGGTSGICALAFPCGVCGCMVVVGEEYERFWSIEKECYQFKHKDCTPREKAPREPWRCKACRALMYNVDYHGHHGHPREGAPEPHYLTAEFPEVCEACYEMGKVIRDKEYWSTIIAGQKKVFNRLKDGGNFLQA